ncbi:uncharacterized protein LOC134318573 [Trichomycterus rosablanca]|uniref:uncharacterized protein LOC134318573 n=1 Tax=Trichomycterus rosablanca TaxID=2290929 RepID=UPI002F356E7F
MMYNPVVLLLILGCVKKPCLQRNSCHDRFGETENQQLQACLTVSCKEALSRCMNQTSHDIVTAMKNEDPSASTKVLQHRGESAVREAMDVFTHCGDMFSPHGAVQLMACLLQKMMDEKHQELIRNPLLMFSDPGFSGCWMRRSFQRLMSCTSVFDQNVLTTVYEHATSGQAGTDCFLEMFIPRGKTCLPESMRFFGSTRGTQAENQDNDNGPGVNWTELIYCFMPMINDITCFQKSTAFYGSSSIMRTQIKDFLMCGIDEMISATAEC